MQENFATAQQLKISNKEAKYFIDKYFDIYSQIKPFMKNILDFAHENAFVENIFGRRRYFQNINSNNKMLQKEEERQAFNTVIQSAAADIMKQAMIKIQRFLDESFTEIHSRPSIILQVHDEIVIEAKSSQAEFVLKHIQSIMESVIELRVPLKANIGTGKNWLLAH